MEEKQARMEAAYANHVDYYNTLADKLQNIGFTDFLLLAKVIKAAEDFGQARRDVEIAKESAALPLHEEKVLCGLIEDSGLHEDFRQFLDGSTFRDLFCDEDAYVFAKGYYRGRILE